MYSYLLKKKLFRVKTIKRRKSVFAVKILYINVVLILLLYLAN